MAKSSREYWRDREEAQRARNITDEAEYRREIERIHRQIMREAQKEISDFYVKYATKNGITLSEAKRRVRRLDMKEYSEKAKEYVKNRDFSAQANAEMELYNLTMKVNRLEMLKADIGMHLVGGYDELQKYFEEELTDTALEEFQRQAGILGNTIQDNAELAHGIVNASFHNASFSDRIWGQYAGFKSALEREITQGLLQGLGSDQLAANIRKTCSEVSARDALRLMVTEMARVRTEVAKQSMEKNGNTEYEFMALGQHPCPVCRGLNGKIFKVKDLMPGENAPPMHPWCHCSTAPHWDEEKYQAWLDSGAAKAGVPFGEFIESHTDSENRQVAEAKAEEWRTRLPSQDETPDKYARSIIDDILDPEDDTPIIWPERGNRMGKERAKQLRRYGKQKGIDIGGLADYDLPEESVKEVVDDAAAYLRNYPELKTGRPSISFTAEYMNSSKSFASTINHLVKINADAYRNLDRLEEEYQKLVKEHWFPHGTDHHALIAHEIGHVIHHRYPEIDTIEIAMRISGMNSKIGLMEYISEHLSEYAAYYKNGQEIISECYACVLTGIDNEFALKFVHECDIIIKKNREEVL